MLVGRYIDDDLGIVSGKYPLQSVLIRNGAEFDLQIQAIAIGNFKLLLHIVGTVFVDVKDDNLLGVHLGQLSTKLRTNGVTAASNQHQLVPVIGIGFLFGHGNGFTDEQFSMSNSLNLS